MANAAMTMGIVAVSLGVVGVPCCSMILLPIGGLLGIFAIVFGFMSSPSRDGQALTGVICGIIALLLVIVGAILQVFLFRMVGNG